MCVAAHRRIITVDRKRDAMFSGSVLARLRCVAVRV